MEREYRTIDLDDLGDTWGPRPADRMVQSVHANGVITPVIVAETTDKDGVVQLTLVDGNRRVAASRAAGLTSIPAVVMRGLSAAELAHVTVIANAMRATNPVTEWWAFDELLTAGSDENDLATISGLSTSTVGNRLLMRELDKSIFEGAARGEIPPTIAMAVARLPKEAQDELAATYDTAGTLRKRDVDAASARYGVGNADPETVRRDLDKLAARAMTGGMTLETWREAGEDAWASAARDDDDSDTPVEA